MSWYKGWDVHAWSSSFSGEASSDKELFGNATQEEIEQVRLEILEKYGSQKSTIVGRAINKFNLATQKLGSDSQGERYLFSREHLEKIYRGYFG